jgi:hypothetical protein
MLVACQTIEERRVLGYHKSLLALPQAVAHQHLRLRLLLTATFKLKREAVAVTHWQALLTKQKNCFLLRQLEWTKISSLTSPSTIMLLQKLRQPRNLGDGQTGSFIFLIIITRHALLTP